MLNKINNQLKKFNNLNIYFFDKMRNYLKQITQKNITKTPQEIFIANKTFIKKITKQIHFKNTKDTVLNNYLAHKNLVNLSTFKFNQLETQGSKLKYNLFIKDDAKLEDLKFKEEIFEYAAIKANEITETEIILALNKLESHVILEAELKEFKFFIRSILEIQDKFRSEFAVIKFINYYLKTYKKDFKTYLDPNHFSIENNQYDLDFSNLNAALLNFGLKNLMKIEHNFNLKSLLDLILLINFTDDKIKKEFLEKIQIKFLQNVNLNLINSPFNLKGIIEEEDLINKSKHDSGSEIYNYKNNDFENTENSKEIDLNMFLLINIIVYQDNKYQLDEKLLGIINYFEARLADKNGLIKYWDQDLNKRLQVSKIETKELQIFNLIYGFMNNWVEAYNKEINKSSINEESKIKKEKSEKNKIELNAENIETKEVNESLKVNLISNEEQLNALRKFLKTVEMIILRNNKITKQSFIKKFKNDTIRYRENVNYINELNDKLINKIISEMEKTI